MLVSLYYLTLWYPLPKLQPKGKTKEPKDDIHDSEHTLLKPKHEAAAALPRPAQPRPDRLSPAQTGSEQPSPAPPRPAHPNPAQKLKEMRHRDRASNLSSRNFQSLMRQSRCLICGFPKWNLPSARFRSCVKDGRAPGRRPTRRGSWVPQILTFTAWRNAELFHPY